MRYGMAVDCSDIETALACHSEHAIYTVSSPTTGRDAMDSGDLHLSGHQAIADMLKSDMHQSLIPNCTNDLPCLLCAKPFNQPTPLKINSFSSAEVGCTVITWCK